MTTQHPTPHSLRPSPLTRLALTRRGLLGSAAALAVGGSLAGCASGGPAQQAGGGTADNPTEITFSFWGPDFYQRFTQQMVDAFHTAHPEIRVQSQPSEWSGYWDRLATMTAGGNPPDVINMDGKYIAEYGGKGVLADLNTLDGLDLSALSDADRRAGTFQDTLYALSTGWNAFVVYANPAVFAEAGVEIPDDTTWTWDDYYRTAEAVSAGSPEGTVGATGGGTYADLTIFLRQHGEDLFADDGVGFTVPTAAQWFEHHVRMMTSGAGLPPAQAQEDGTVPYEQQAFPTGRSAMFWSWTNQLENARNATGEEVQMLRPPSETGSAEDNGLFLKASMFWSIAARSAHLAESATFVNFLLNDPAASQIQLLARGVPSSQEVLDALEPNLSETDSYIAEWLGTVGEEITLPPPHIEPEGAADHQNVIARALEEVRFERLTPTEAAQRLADDLNAKISAAG